MFVPNPNNLPEVNHKENMDYAITDGNMTRDKYGRYCHK